MESQVCVHCLNKKVINSTSNRLVTESCGHVKCMDCLVHEKAGCVACAQKISPKGPDDSPEPSQGPPSDGDNAEQQPLHTHFPLKHFLLGEDTEKGKTEYYSDQKNKLETSHIRIETDGNNKYYNCTACKRKFQARSQVAYHAYCNGQQKPYQCPECTKSFATHSHFKYHMRVHRNERAYACDLCGESFFQMSKLQRHKLKHTKEKKYVCAECSKAFNNLSSLRKHGLTHTEERPYGCETCGRRFRDSSNYRKHVAKHDGSRGPGAGGGARLPCPRCPQAFRARRDLRRHAAVHTDAKPFRCLVCGRRFRRKDNLERHGRNTHPEQPAAAALRDLSPVPDTPDAPDTSAHAHTARTHDELDKDYQNEEKTKLEILNPLPPLPPEAIRRHLEEDENKDKETRRVEDEESGKAAAGADKTLAEILHANHLRRSVIYGPARAPPPREYVHKLRRAPRAPRAPRDPRPPPLPPVDPGKLRQLARLAHQNDLDVGAPPEKYRELYKKILYERSEREREKELAHEDELHWRKKMKLSINW